MSASFASSTEKLSKAIEATEAVQKSAREFLKAQSAWTDAFHDWASEESNPAIKAAFGSAMPLFELWSDAQASFIAEMRSFVYYDMGLLMGVAEEYHAATKATDKARSNLKKKQDDAQKPGERGTKAAQQVPEAKQELNKCKMIEARERDRFTKLKHVVIKNSMMQVSSNFLQMFSKGSHLYNGVYEVVEAMPDDPPENPTTFDTMSEMMQKATEFKQSVPDSVECRYPGVFLHKKAEKFGKEKKRFFQLEQPEDGGPGATFAYYVDVIKGVPHSEKGKVALTAASQIECKRREIRIENPDRKWILVAKTIEEARWWSALLVKASRDGVPDYAVYRAVEVAVDEVHNLEDDRLRLDTVARRTTMNPDMAEVDGGGAASPLEGEQYVLNNDFKSEEGEGTLNVKVGDVVVVGEKGDDWWFVADERGNDGWCPAAFLDPSEAAGAQAAPAEPSPEPAAPSPDAPAEQQAEGRYVRAAYDNEGAEEDELSFKEGDQIFQTQDADEYGWSRGILNGVEGIYPAAYVEEM
eukprot:CAMPEP_0182925428 /NCGR_PEP_ID=MMETSP0105_2-20130417/9408_1 /TAXON_ID=81532 ORGANISM="Acanthoeca-like sp., Strain 10tr" /NCGR_SAMPLE_ID=MMETSP0105_2 /ASSEMBLY_ACC=CAM_ASM_000205 /LENGTH=524 /DNA_ID=CAMNT_0025063277 /DNA_START=76 /DNA_END=1650 /DNA_ORIENTATION=-